MISRLHLAHWGLVTVAMVSTVAAVNLAWTLFNTNRINAFISMPTLQEAEEVPTHKKAQFAHAFYQAEQGQTEQALALLTTVATSHDKELEAASYYNRANINLREAIALPTEDTGRVALIGLAKQDYRNALLIDSSLWDARFNLEYALMMSPEESDGVSVSEWGKKGSSRVIVKAVGFRVDLP